MFSVLYILYFIGFLTLRVVVHRTNDEAGKIHAFIFKDNAITYSSLYLGSCSGVLIV